MRAVVCLLLVLCAIASAKRGFYSGKHLENDVNDYSFQEFLLDFEKSYEPSELALREEIFNANMADIRAQNSRAGRTWNAGVNFFADMTPKEISRYRGFSLPMALANRKKMQESPAFHVDVDALPTAIDWRTHKPNVVTPVKDQGSCGSCWAHSATETIESAVALATGKLMELSRQNIMRCTANPDHCGGTGQCEGATAELGFGYVESKGVASEAAYPYTGTDGSCDESIPKVATVTGFVALPANNYTSLMTAVATVGPISISVDASSWSFYSSGIFNSCGYSSIDIDHAVQLVGYGVSGSTKYWIVRNSWSSGWGEDGYIRLHREDVPQCGIDYSPQDGSGCTGGPSQITVCGECGMLSDSSYVTGAKLWH